LKVSAIIPWKGDHNFLKNCLNGIFAQRSCHFDEVIVVSCNPPLEDNNLLESYDVTVLYSSIMNTSHARNLGLKNASQPLVAFIDSDVVIAEDWLEKVCSKLNKDGLGGVDSPLTSHPDNKSWVSRYRFQRKKLLTKDTWSFFDKSKKAFTLDSAACLYRKDLLMKFNGFETSLKRLEDIDISYKVANLSKIGTCLETSAQEFVLEGAITYLKKSFQNGRSGNDLMLLWGSRKRKNTNHFVLVKGFYLFSLLNCFFFELGSFVGGYINTTSKGKSLKQIKLVKSKE
jgi:glycosyltransferase involved in cell wall biosynthesis